MPVWLLVLLVIFAVFALLLYAPVWVKVTAGDEFSYAVKYLFFTYHPKPRKEEPKTATKAKKKKEKEKPELPPLEGLLDLIKAIWPPLRRMIRSVKIRDLIIRIKVGGSDAAETAISYGKMCGYISAGSALLFNIFKSVKIEETTVEPDFTAGENKYYLSLRAGIRPIRIIYTALVVLSLSLPFLMKFARAPKRESDTKLQESPTAA